MCLGPKRDAQSDPTKTAALKAIIAISKRLLHDAVILECWGSAGSALRLAILAFEEAGKGHIAELVESTGAGHAAAKEMLASLGIFPVGIWDVETGDPQ